jgi:hypothetical protein
MSTLGGNQIVSSASQTLSTASVPGLSGLMLYGKIGDPLNVFIRATDTDAYRASLKEEKRNQVGSEMSDLAHPSDYAQPEPDGRKSKYQK